MVEGENRLRKVDLWPHTLKPIKVSRGCFGALIINDLQRRKCLGPGPLCSWPSQLTWKVITLSWIRRWLSPTHCVVMASYLNLPQFPHRQCRPGNNRYFVELLQCSTSQSRVCGEFWTVFNWSQMIKMYPVATRVDKSDCSSQAQSPVPRRKISEKNSYWRQD